MSTQLPRERKTHTQTHGATLRCTKSMSKLRIPSTHKPPIAQSASRIPTGRNLRSATNFVQSTPVSFAKTRIPNRASTAEKPNLGSISCDLNNLVKMVEGEFGNGPGSVNNLDVNPSVVYERGKFYEEYAARRNERLSRKKGVIGTEKKTPYSLGVTVESGKKREAKKLGTLRKSLPPNFSVTATPSTRYSLRSSARENKKPPLAPVPVAVNLEKSVKTGTKRTTRGI